MNIETYHSINAPEHRSWMAYVVSNGHCFGIRFPAATEERAIAMANEWWSAELERIGGQKGVNSIIPADQVIGFMPVKSQPRKFDSQPMLSVGIGRGQGFVGKVWMLNRATGHRVRCDNQDAERFAQAGYVKAGPRSK